MQVRLDLWIDDLDQAEAQLHQLGTTNADPQPPGPDGLIVMHDPAGQLFCICARGQSAHSPVRYAWAGSPDRVRP
jgi:hypothetical protein